MKFLILVALSYSLVTVGAQLDILTSLLGGVTTTVGGITSGGALSTVVAGLPIVGPLIGGTGLDQILSSTSLGDLLTGTLGSVNTLLGGLLSNLTGGLSSLLASISPLLTQTATLLTTAICQTSGAVASIITPAQGLLSQLATVLATTQNIPILGGLISSGVLIIIRAVVSLVNCILGAVFQFIGTDNTLCRVATILIQTLIGGLASLVNTLSVLLAGFRNGFDVATLLVGLGIATGIFLANFLIGLAGVSVLLSNTAPALVTSITRCIATAVTSILSSTILGLLPILSLVSPLIGTLLSTVLGYLRLP